MAIVIRAGRGRAYSLAQFRVRFAYVSIAVFGLILARKITVENSPEHLKKSVASLLVRRLLAVWVIENVMIRRLAVRELPTGILSRPLPSSALPKRSYIPAKLPPAEVGGCHFKPPASALLNNSNVLRLIRIATIGLGLYLCGSSEFPLI